MNDRRTCVTCKFCDVQDTQQGICRLAPPTTALIMNAGAPGAMAVRVVVSLASDWCSKYEQQLVKPAGPVTLEMVQRGKEK